jgi:colicin import membrane protein
MKKLFVVIMLFIPMMTFAQSEWEIPQTPEQKAEAEKEAAKKAKKEAKEAKQKAKDAENNKQRLADAESQAAHSDAPQRGLFDKNSGKKQDSDNSNLKVPAKYLEGAVPVNKDGMVEWKTGIDAAGKSADDLFNIVYNFCDTLTRSDSQIKGSRIALINKTEHTIVCTIKEWLVFQNSSLCLDRSQFNYNLIIKCTDGHIDVTMNRVSYDYEKDRSTGFSINAEEWITDELGMNKKHTNVSRMSGKFRMKSIDRKNEITRLIKESVKESNGNI